MRNRISYATPIDALIDFATRVGGHENKHGMESADFYSRYRAGKVPCENHFIAWAMDYDNFLYLQGVAAERMESENVA